MRDMQPLFCDKNATRLKKQPVNPYIIRIFKIATIEWE